jgi:8-oxo-dGTP pyrophosphatase MutT (NUDIX family)
MTVAEPGSSDAMPIRDAACVVVVDDSGTEPRLLLGRRHANQVFLPNKWVFPGGHVDAGDSADAARHAASGTWPLAENVRPFAVAAVRELAEETGNVIGDAAIATLRPLARAITPPGRPRRYDTWFFLTRRAAITGEGREADGELLDLAWFTVAETRRLDLPNITRLVLEDANVQLDATMGRDGLIPFYFHEAGSFRRTMIDPWGAG